jgi:hypothetical protein
MIAELRDRNGAAITACRWRWEFRDPKLSRSNSDTTPVTTWSGSPISGAWGIFSMSASRSASDPANRSSRFSKAAQLTVRSLPEWRSKYLHLIMRRGRKIAMVGMARKRRSVCTG